MPEAIRAKRNENTAETVQRNIEKRQSEIEMEGRQREDRERERGYPIVRSLGELSRAVDPQRRDVRAERLDGEEPDRGEEGGNTLGKARAREREEEENGKVR